MISHLILLFLICDPVNLGNVQDLSLPHDSIPHLLTTHNSGYTGGSDINPKVDIDFAKKECHKLMEHGTDAVKWLGIFTGVLSMLQIITGTGIMVG